MEDPKTYEVSVSLKIRDGESYSQASIASVSVTDQVPPSVDPVAHLRSLIGREFKRKFSDLELPYEDNPVFDGGN